MPHNLPTWIEISKSAFDHNISQLKSAIGDRALAAVVKANAYGHGMQEIASLAAQNNMVDWLCVSCSSEAVALRNLGIKKPILVIGLTDSDPAEMINTNIHLMIDTYERAQQLNCVGATHGYRFPVHIKVDTGLSRFGITPRETIDFIKKIQTLPYITIQGIYSHFSESQNKDRTFTNQQIAEFKTVLQAVKEQNLQIPFVHLANSAATTTIDLPFCNLFRIGLSIYGIWPTQEVKDATHKQYPNYTLQPVLTWKSRIASLKTFPENSCVGYARTFKTISPTRVATIPVGYYDGYDMRFSNNAFVLLHNQYAPVIGRVAMNTTTIDVTDIPHVAVGDELILIGNYPHIHPHELVNTTQNLNIRAIITTINPHIPRIICS